MGGLLVVGGWQVPWFGLSGGTPYRRDRAAVVYGSGDGLMGAFIDSFTTAATGAEQRAGFVSATGAIHNLAKFTALAALGGFPPAYSVRTIG